MLYQRAAYADHLLPVGKHSFIVFSAISLEKKSSLLLSVDTMSHRRCIEPCDRFITAGDTHDWCVIYLIFVNDDLRPTPQARNAVSMVVSCMMKTCCPPRPLIWRIYWLNRAVLSLQADRRNVLLDVVTCEVDKLGLDWDSKPAQNQTQSKLDDRFLTNRTPSQPSKPHFFFQYLHHEVSRSWKQPFSAHITNPSATDFATVSKMADHGYAVMLAIEETLAAHLPPT